MSTSEPTYFDPTNPRWLEHIELIVEAVVRTADNLKMADALRASPTSWCVMIADEPVDLAPSEDGSPRLQWTKSTFDRVTLYDKASAEDLARMLEVYGVPTAKAVHQPTMLQFASYWYMQDIRALAAGALEFMHLPRA